MDPISSIERNIGIMARNNQALSSMLSQLAAGRPAADLRILLQDTAHIARETGELLLTAQQGLNTAPARQQAVLIKLGKDFQIILKRFQHLTEQSARQAQQPATAAADGPNSYSAPPPPSVVESGSSSSSRHARGRAALEDDDEEDDDDNEQGPRLRRRARRRRRQVVVVVQHLRHGGGTGAAARRRRSRSRRLPPSTQQQQVQAQIQQKAVDVDVIKEREQIITQVETTLGEVGEIFSELRGLVSEQSGHIDHISTAIENTAAQAGRAADELWHASRSQNRSRSRTLCMGLGLLGGVVVFLIVMSSLRV